MPLYQQHCEECGHSEAFFRSMQDASDNPPCPECGEIMGRDFHAEAAGPHLNKNFDTPIEMQSIALMHPEDIAAFKRRNPGVEVKDGVPIAHNRAEKLRILKQEGYEERN